MKTTNTLIIAAIAASFASINADADIGDPSSSTPKFDIPKVADNRPKQKQEELTVPGIYRSKPYLSIIIVPKSVDPVFEHKLGADTQMDNFVIRPPTHLEPYQPDR